MEVRQRKLERGQAAIMDALFMLMMVSFLSTMMYYFASNYGVTVDPKLSTQYGTEYVDSALKTISYISVDRQPGIDYLLAMIKEDYYDDYLLDEYVHIVSYNVMRIMEPISDEYDYIFFIYNYEEEDLGGVEYPQHLIYMQVNYAGLRSDPPEEALEITGENLYFDEECILGVHPDLPSPHFPANPSGVTKPFNFEDLQMFVAEVPNSVASTAPLMFIRNTTVQTCTNTTCTNNSECGTGKMCMGGKCCAAESGEQPKYMKMGLIMWPSITNEKMDDLILNEWSCFDIDSVKNGSKPLQCINALNPDPLANPPSISGC